MRITRKPKATLPRLGITDSRPILFGTDDEFTGKLSIPTVSTQPHVVVEYNLFSKYSAFQMPDK